MTSPLSTQANFEKKWNGFENVGRYSGQPAIFLYYGEDGVDKDYTVDSITREFDGYGWTSNLTSYDSHLVFSGLSGQDPLDSQYNQEIIDFLDIQRHKTVRAHTPANTIPDDEIDDLFDYYTLVFRDDEFDNLANSAGSVFEWYVNEHEHRDRVDFVFGFENSYSARDSFQSLRGKYPIRRNRIWIYPESPEKYEDTFNMAKSLGFNFCYPPDYYRLKQENPEYFQMTPDDEEED